MESNDETSDYESLSITLLVLSIILSILFGVMFYINNPSREVFSYGVTGAGGTVLCFQETANISTACGGLNTGSYGCSGNFASAAVNCSKAYDANYSSGAIVAASGGPAIVYINYSKPSAANESSLWQVKWSPTSGGTMFANYSIPTSCWAQEPLQFRVLMDYSSFIQFDCMNESSWYNLYNNSGLDPGVLFEEAMWWNMTGYPDTNVSIWNGSEWLYYNSTNRMKFRCGNPPTVCEPQNQNSSASQPIFSNMNNGSITSNEQFIKSNISYTSFYCYQESANTTNQSGIDGACGQVYNGTYDFTGLWVNAPPAFAYTNTVDGDYSTRSATSGIGTAIIDINYTKPSLANSSSQWQVKMNIQGVISTQNYSIPTDCWAQNPLQLRIQVATGLANSTYIACQNGSGYQNISIYESLVASELFEEGMYWRVIDPFLLCGTSTNYSLATPLQTESFNRYATDSISPGANQSVYCWLNVTSVGPDFPRSFSITLNNSG